MQDFAEALAQFARGELKHGDLFDFAERQSATGRLDSIQTANTLDTLLRQGELSSADYLSIKDYIEHITRKRATDSDDATVLHTPAPSPGEILKNRFVLETVIGRGGMGTIFKARDLRKEEAQDKDPFVAVKVLNPSFRDDPDALVIFQREAKKAQTLAHPNIATVYDFDRDGATIFLTMEWLQGQSLSDFMKDHRGDTLPLAQTRDMIHGMAAALSYAHSKQIVHLDFKPANAFLLSDNTVKVLDFGIARAIKQPEQQNHDATTFILSKWEAMTPAYASPEMFEKQAPDPRDDIYALACVCYELLAGKHPYQRLPALQARQMGLQPDNIASLTPAQNAALEHALALTRESRTPSIQAFLEEFEPPATAASAVPAASDVPVRRNNKTALLGAGLAALILLGSGLVYMLSSPFRDSPSLETAATELETQHSANSAKPTPQTTAAIEEQSGLIANSESADTTLMQADSAASGTQTAQIQELTQAPIETQTPSALTPAIEPDSQGHETTLAKFELSPSTEPSRTAHAGADVMPTEAEPAAVGQVEQLKIQFERHLSDWELTSGKAGSAIGVLTRLEADYNSVPGVEAFVQDGRERVASAYLSLAQSAYNNGQYTRAKSFVNKGSEISPDQRFASLSSDIEQASSQAQVAPRTAKTRVFNPECDLDELERQFSLGGDITDLPPECLKR